MSWTTAIRFLDQHTRLGAVPTPAFVQRALDAHQRRQRLVVEIAALSDRHTAVAALWLARAEAIANLADSNVTVERVLSAVHELAMAGAIEGK